jgi:type VI secretion system FHA domain protein
MPLRLEITSYHQRRLKEARVKEFGIDGGSIGRSLESDWVLQDGKRYVSSRHAAIDFRSGSYYIVDVSSNGVYVNNEVRPVGKAQPQRLFDGDRIRIGEYEMVAHIVESAGEGDQLSNEHHVDPVDQAQRVDKPDLTGHELVSEHEMTAVGIEDLLLESAEASVLKRAALKAAAGMTLETESSAPKRIPKSLLGRDDSLKRQPEAAEDLPKNSPSIALYAFFKGAGLPPKDLEDQEASIMLHQLGQLMRELVIGLTDSLHFRAEQKNELRIPGTIIQAKNNNPLKFSAGVDEALSALISEQSAEYQNAIDSTREAFQDLKDHQTAMLDAVRIALSDFIERLDPDELEQNFDHGTKRYTFIGVANKLRYWDLYRDIFQALSQRAPGRFPQIFSEELSRAYEEEVARLKGKRRTDDSAQTAADTIPQEETG